MGERESCCAKFGQDYHITMEVLIEIAALPFDEGEEMS